MKYFDPNPILPVRREAIEHHFLLKDDRSRPSWTGPEYASFAENDEPSRQEMVIAFLAVAFSASLMTLFGCWIYWRFLGFACH
ncbi:hypothetical protein MCBRY_001026 [Methylocystis bryophila]